MDLKSELTLRKMVIMNLHKVLARLKTVALNARLNFTAILPFNTRDRIGLLRYAPTHLSLPERLLLYSLIRGACPARALEIGTALGGSAAIMAGAMEDNHVGLLIGLDPATRVDENQRYYHGRFRIIRTAAPEGIEKAAQLAGGSFDFVFYDGPNIHTETARIITALTPHLSENAFVIVDNGFHYGVHQAIIDVIAADARFRDCGFISVGLGVHDPNVAYNGLRLVRFAAQDLADPQPEIQKQYGSAGLSVPQYHPDILNHDGWWCRTIQRCPRCAADQLKSQEPSPDSML